ncbi:hypothetical protein PANT_20d00029 [Moesziomyces antarcticus T-34]|uniref:Aromatic-L-amino-acid decarboxylase n=1 Tax=Pseudozyma antarctica (strain T-34) TaxID=1151754 RepID=M9LS54_PSEA3|nr:hypothetical protein PANT_20d00029 [Moesziomyces antarcticus T-34]
MAVNNYKHPNLKEQWGLAEDPNASDHIVTSRGQKLTRTVTAGGHDVDSSQPGFPIYHRRIANPFPLVCIATGASVLMLGFILVRNRSITNPSIYMAMALPLGMFGNFAACMFAFAEGSTYLATISGTLAGLLGGTALQFLPWTGIQATYLAGGAAGLNEYYKAEAMVYFIALIPIFLIFVASARTSGPVAGAALLITVALALLGAAYIGGAEDFMVAKASGAIFIIIGIMLFYAALSVMLAEEGWKILPGTPTPTAPAYAGTRRHNCLASQPHPSIYSTFICASRSRNMDIEGFRKAGYAAVDRICDYYASLAERPVSAQVQPGFLSASIPTSAPETGEAWERIDNDYHSVIMPGITHCFEGALADLYCASISNPGFNWSVSPSVTELEILMVDWVGRMLGLDDAFLSTSGTGGGIILGSASEVALTVAIAARERCIDRLTPQHPMPTVHTGTNGVGSLDADQDVASAGQSAAEVGADATLVANTRLAQWRGGLTSRLVMYGTTQTHTIAAKAALILGLDFRALPVSAESSYSLSGATLAAAIAEDVALGRVPFMLIATIGTTSSGAVDNLTEIVEVVAKHPTLWLHIDAAYAGVCLSLPELRAEMHLDAINSAAVDSFSTNLHKWGLVQFDCSPLHVRDRGDLSRALGITPTYLRTKQADAGNVLDLRNLQISLGRRFRSLKVWFVLRSYGLEGFRKHLRTTMQLANHFESLLRADDAGLLEIVALPRWALVVFRMNPKGEGVDVEQLNKAFWDDLEAQSAHFVLTQTSLPEVGFCIRFVVGSPQTQRHHVEHTWKLVAQTARSTWARFKTSCT